MYKRQVLQNDWKRLYDEVKTFKLAAKNKHIKAILGVGDLETMRNVAKASLVCMMAGADFIKTSTGKETINANLNNSLVMLRMIREFHERTKKKIGIKPAGGISSAKSVIARRSILLRGSSVQQCHRRRASDTHKRNRSR